jgi:uncharacterized membrane protein
MLSVMKLIPVDRLGVAESTRFPSPNPKQNSYMSIAWHYMKNGAQTGPATTDELKALITSGAIKADTLVWRDSLPAWAAANTQSEFAGVAGPAVPPPAPASASGGPGVFTPDAADVDKNKVMGILSYLGPLWLVPLLAAKDSPFAKYHCNQGLVLILTAVAVWIVNMVLVFIPIIGWLLMFCLSIGLLVLCVMGIINAANGVCKPLPLIGDRFILIK